MKSQQPAVGSRQSVVSGQAQSTVTRNSTPVTHYLFMNKLTDAQKRYIEKLQQGQRATGRVKSFQEFGAFVSIGLVNGLLHNKNIRWGRVDHPEHYLRIGQQLEVIILEVDHEKHRFSLGLKQLQPDPWDKFCERYKPGDYISGSVIRILPYGMLLEIVNGIDALMHISDLPEGTAIDREFHIEDTFEVQIKAIDREKRRVNVTMR